MDEALAKLATYLGDRLGTRLLASEVALGELTIAVERDSIRETIQLLRDDQLCRFGCLIDICGVDYPERDERFDVVYHLLSPSLNHRIRVRVRTDAETPVPASSRCFRQPTGSSAKPTTSTASCSRTTPTCGACSPITAFRAIRCARIFRSLASSSSDTTTS